MCEIYWETVRIRVLPLGTKMLDLNINAHLLIGLNVFDWLIRREELRHRFQHSTQVS